MNQQKFQEYLQVTEPLSNLEEFTMSAMNGMLSNTNSIIEPTTIAEYATQTALATLSKLYELQNP